MVEHRSAESEGLSFDSSWGLRIFSLSHARDELITHLSLFRSRAQNLPSPLFYLQRKIMFVRLFANLTGNLSNNDARILTQGVI